MVIPCLSSFLLTVLRTPAVELPVNKKRTRTLFHKESGSSTNCLDGFLCLNTLSDKRKYECQQCKNEHTKSHKVFEIKMIIVLVSRLLAFRNNSP